MFVDKQQFTAAELEAKETAFRKIMADTPQAEALFEELDTFFLGKKTEDIQAVYWTYWRWFVAVTWELLNGLRPEKVAGALATQAPMALLCGRDVWKQIINYLGFSGYSEKEMPIRYSDMRDAFLNSDMPIGKWDAGDITIQQLVVEVKKINRLGVSSLEKAEFTAKLKKALMPAADSIVTPYIEVKAEDVIDKLIGLINFFLGVEPKDAWGIVDMAMYPQEYENLAKLAEGTLVPTVATAEPVAAPVTPATPKPAPVAPKPVAVPVSPAPAATPVTPSKPVVNLADVKKMLEKKFPKNANGQFVDPTQVLAMLNDLATRYRDERVRELYVYNENTSTFEWNNSLV